MRIVFSIYLLLFTLYASAGDPAEELRAKLILDPQAKASFIAFDEDPDTQTPLVLPPSKKFDLPGQTDLRVKAGASYFITDEAWNVNAESFYTLFPFGSNTTAVSINILKLFKYYPT